MIPYRNIRSTLKTGDIVLFRGKGAISALILCFCTLCSRRKARYSHIGIIVVDGGRVMLFESTTLHGKNGVQLNPLSEILQVYKGKAFLRRLVCERDERFYEIINSTMSELLNRPYEKSVVELMGAASAVASFFMGHRSDLSSVFCSELVSEILKRLGFLPSLLPPNKYSPDEYAFRSEVDEKLRFCDKEVCLSKPVQMK